jgi:hypothetical protein
LLDAEAAGHSTVVNAHIIWTHANCRRTELEPVWTLFEGIERWAERKAMLTHEDVKARHAQPEVADGQRASSMSARTLTFPIR